MLKIIAELTKFLLILSQVLNLCVNKVLEELVEKEKIIVLHKTYMKIKLFKKHHLERRYKLLLYTQVLKTILFQLV